MTAPSQKPRKELNPVIVCTHVHQLFWGRKAHTLYDAFMILYDVFYEPNVCSWTPSLTNQISPSNNLKKMFRVRLF